MAQERPAFAGRRQAYYSGQVQGVGFRYTVRQLAENYAVAGFVQNLPDGRVELLVEGTAEELDGFMGDIAQRLSDHIRDVSINVRPAISEFDAFEIRH